MERIFEKKIYKWNLWKIILIVIAFSLVIYISLPFLQSIILGLIIGYILHPIYNKLRQYIKNDIVTACIVMAVFFIPLIFFSIVIIQWMFSELVEIYLGLSKIKIATSSIKSLPPYFSPSILVWNILQKMSKFISSYAFQTTQQIIVLCIKFLILLVVCFFALIEGSKWKNQLIKVFPQEKRITFMKFIIRLDQVYYNIYIAHLYTAVIVFFLSLIFFYVIHAKYLITYSIASFLFALIPVFDAWMICMLISLLYFLKGMFLKAILVAVFGSFLLSVVPGYILRPAIAKKKGSVHGGLIFIAYLIGPFVLGLAGFLIVPSIFGFFQVCLEFFVSEK